MRSQSKRPASQRKAFVVSKLVYSIGIVYTIVKKEKKESLMAKLYQRRKKTDKRKIKKKNTYKSQ
jgi:hypothetical protein